MKAWVANLQVRERLILLGGIVAVVLIGAWFGLTKMRSGTEVLRDAVAQKQRLLIAMQPLEGQVPQGAVPGDGQTLVVLIANTAQQHNLALTRTRPDGPDGIQVTFGNASFDTLMSWLIALEKQYSVNVESASFQSGRQRGIVNGQLLLRRS
jgi:type II secretory pathway component PulM